MRPLWLLPLDCEGREGTENTDDDDEEPDCADPNENTDDGAVDGVAKAKGEGEGEATAGADEDEPNTKIDGVGTGRGAVPKANGCGLAAGTGEKTGFWGDVTPTADGAAPNIPAP